MSARHSRIRNTNPEFTSLPVWTFVGILLFALGVALFPPDLPKITSRLSPPPGEPKQPALFVYPVGLPGAAAACPNRCKYTVCTAWVPGPSPQCPNPGSGGGCCVAEEERCDRNCEEEETQQPPSISGVLNCTQTGADGWCAGALSLDLTASDPQGQTVLISGNVNGTAFACPNGATSCSVPLPEGSGTATYQVNSATGLSASGSVDFWRDSTAPQIDGSLSGSGGENDWFISPVEVEASASDSGSGLAAFEYNLDGSGWTPYNGTIALGDGVHTVEFQARDTAGNTASTSQTVMVDTVTPVINLSADGTGGVNGWWLSDIKLSATASDATSGIDSFEYSLDGGAWTDYTAELTYPEGEYSLRFRAIDNAGNTTVTPAQEYRIDTTPPIVELPASWNLGTRVQYEVRDAGSGTGSVRIVIEDDLERWPKVVWNDGNYEPTFVEYIAWDGRFANGNRAPDGEYLATVKALDQAGNETQKSGIITVEANLLTLLLPPSPLQADPLPPEADTLGIEDEEWIPTTGLFTSGGIGAATGTATKMSFSSPTPSAAEPAAGSDAIAWGAAASAVLGAFLAEVQRRKEQEARAAAEAFEQHLKKTGKWKQGQRDNPLTYRQIAQAYQASLDSFQNELIAAGLSAEQAQAQKQKAIQAGTIPPSAKTVAASVKASPKVEAAPMPPPSMPTGISPEAQAAFAHGGAAAQNWVAGNAAQLQQSYLEQQAAAQERSRKEQAQAADAARWTGLAAMEQAKAAEKSWWESAWDAATTFVQEKVVKPAQDIFNQAVTSAGNLLTEVQKEYEEVKEEIGLRWEAIKETYTVVSATLSNYVTTAFENQWHKSEYVWNYNILHKPMHVPTVELLWDPALPTFQSFIQNQLSLRPLDASDPDNTTADVECVTTSAVDVRNMMNAYLAKMTGLQPLPELMLQDYVDATDTDPSSLLPVRVSSPVVIELLGKPAPIGGFMHPRFQLLGALEEFSQEFDAYYGYSFEVQQSSYNTLDDIAAELQQGHLVIVSGMNPPTPDDVFQEFLGGNPHTMGSVVEINASTNQVTVMDTDGNLNDMDVPDFLKWWGRQSTGNLYVETNTMTVIIPDAMPAAATTNPAISTPQAVPMNVPTPSPSGTPSTTPTITSASSTTSAPSSTPSPPPTDTPRP